MTLRSAWEWLRALLRGRREDDELREEIAFHLEQDVAAQQRRGLTAAAARRAALARFGGTERFVEETRDARGTRGVFDVARDFRIAARGLRRSPLFTGVVVLALALGIGATTAMFGLVNRVLLRPTPGVLDADELVMIRMQEDEFNYTGISHPTFTELRAATPALAAFAGYSSLRLQTAAAGGAPVVLPGEAVLGDYFGTLGINPERGRLFTAAELGPGGDPFVIVLRADVAEQLFADAAPVGKALRVNGHTFRVIGTVSRSFRGVETLRETAAWVPPTAHAVLNHMTVELTEWRFDPFMQQFGRLAPGATAALAQTQLRQRMNQLRAQYPDELELYEQQPPTVSGRLGLGPGERRILRTMLVLLFGVSLLVLVIACANVANLLIFRGVVRRGEAAVRRALGASLPRLLQQYLAEGLLLALAGAAGGVLLTMLLTSLLAGSDTLGPVAGQLGLDWRVLAFTTAAALLVSLLFATVPTLMTRGLDLVTTLRQTSRSETGRIGVLRGGLVVVQLACSVALLIGSLLMGRTLRALSEVDLGFDATHTISFTVDERSQGYNAARRAAFQQQLAAAATAVPGVRSVAVSRGAPFVSAYSVGELRNPVWSPEREPIAARVAWISPSYFETLGIPLLQGRTFTTSEAADTNSQFIVLSRTAALRLFGATDVVGRTVHGGFNRRGDRTVIGVVGDVRHSRLRGDIEPGFFLPIGTNQMSGFELVVNSAGSLADVDAKVRGLLRSIDPDMPFERVSLVGDNVRTAMARERFIGRATLLLAALAGLLAGIGLYGLLAYSVAQRTREIGIRIALGARPAAIIAWVTGRMLTLTGIGLVLGLAGGLALGSALRSHLFGVAPTDLVSSLAAAAILLVVGALAAFIPARAAVAVHPGTALRSD